MRHVTSSRGEAKHCLLVVPSVMAASENKCLVNPTHADYMKVRIETCRRSVTILDCLGREQTRAPLMPWGWRPRY